MLARLGLPTILALLAASVAHAREETAPLEAEDPGLAIENTREVAHTVGMKLLEPGVLELEVTRAFAARSASLPVCLAREFEIPGEGVITAFALHTEGRWQAGQLRRARPSRLTSIGNAPWASLEWLNGHQVEIKTPVFHSTGYFEVRYKIWTRGEPTETGYSWEYCPEDDSVDPLLISTAESPLAVRADEAYGPRCQRIEAPQPPQTKLSARYGFYPLGPEAWWWRLELSAPKALMPVPPEPERVMFVLDASRSQTGRGGLEVQLETAKAYLTHTPKAQVELVRVARTAERVFGRFLPARDSARSLSTGLAQKSLENGSFLDRGVALAAESLAADGHPGRILLFTDGELRSRFDQRGVLASLRRAPPGTIVHVVYPRRSSTAIRHEAHEGLSAIAAAFGGATYSVLVSPKPTSTPGELAALVSRLVTPDRLESIELKNQTSAEAWPDFLESPFFPDELAAGQVRIWSGLSRRRPPERLLLKGWVWSSSVVLPMPPDPRFERSLPRLATADAELMACHTSLRHRELALRHGFLAPGLVFWVPGAGLDSLGEGGIQSGCNSAVDRGRGHRFHAPPREALPPELLAAVRVCGLVPDPKGNLHAEIETRREEILDVLIHGGDTELRRCAEEALWAFRLPERFNEHRATLESYRVAFSAAH